MKFRIYFASDNPENQEPQYVEVNTIKDLEDIFNKYLNGLLIYFDEDPTIIIHDDYVDCF